MGSSKLKSCIRWGSWAPLAMHQFYSLLCRTAAFERSACPVRSRIPLLPIRTAPVGSNLSSRGESANANTCVQITYLNSVVMPDENPESDSSDENDSGDEDSE